METRRIGNLSVSLVGIGCNNFGGRIDAAATQAVVDAAFDAGINFFDTADIYGGTLSEELLGQSARRPARRRDHRDQVRHGRRHEAARRCERDVDRRGRRGQPAPPRHRSHRPVPAPRARRPHADRRDARGDATSGSRRQGASRSGARTSTDRASTTPRARPTSTAPPASSACRTSSACCADGARRICSRRPHATTSRSSRTSRWRAGCSPASTAGAKRRPRARASRDCRPSVAKRRLSDRRFDVVEALDAFAAERGHTLLELAMSWLAGLPHLASVIAGATKPEQVRANAAAVGWQLTPDDRAEIDRLTT